MNTDPRPETVKAYLDQLQRALKGASPGLISDALTDAEEHLRGEIQSNPERTEAEVLASVVETYGTPAEIAEEYKSMEATIQGPFPKSEQAPEQHPGFFGVIGDPRAYGALMYMLLSVVTGSFYFAWTLLFGLLAMICSIFIFGIPLLFLFVGSVWLLSFVEGRIVEGLLGVRMPRRVPNVSTDHQTIWTRIWETFTDIRTWSSIFYLLLMFPLGLIYFFFAVFGLVIPVAFAGTAFVGLTTGHVFMHVSDVPWLDHLFHTAPGLMLTIVVSVLILFVTLHIAKGIGWLHGRIAEVLLVRL